MKILLLGGTGAMGRPLIKLLSKKHNVIVTSRKCRETDANTVTYIQGNGKELTFLNQILEDHYDCIVDFLTYSSMEFEQRYLKFLQSTDQYVFISSARVYAECEGRITEDSPRLLDVCHDEEYLRTDEYALAKAREEDMLFHSGHKNWTIIRPSITYSDIRLQLGVLEKENWLYRALRGRSIVFSNDICNKYTTMTTADDVARAIAELVGNANAFGEVFHITGNKAYRWEEILNCYLSSLNEYYGRIPKVVMTDKAVKLNISSAKYQVIYCRSFNRRFDNSKINQFVNLVQF